MPALRFLPIFAVAAVALAGSIGSASAQTLRPSLYERLGGHPALSAVVDDFIGIVATDRRINGFFAKADIPRLKTRLVEQLCQASGGPCSYSGADMKSAHAGMGVRNSDFNAMLQDLIRSLNRLKVPKAEQREIAAVLLSMRRDVVTR